MLTSARLTLRDRATFFLTVGYYHFQTLLLLYLVLCYLLLPFRDPGMGGTHSLLVASGLVLLLTFIPSITYFAAAHALSDWPRVALYWGLTYGSQDLVILRAIGRCLRHRPLAWVPTNTRSGRLGSWCLLPELCFGGAIAAVALVPGSPRRSWSTQAPIGRCSVPASWPPSPSHPLARRSAWGPRRRGRLRRGRDPDALCPGGGRACRLPGPVCCRHDTRCLGHECVGAYVSPFSVYRYDASYAVEVQRAHPDGFALVKPVDPDDPAMAEVIAVWKKIPGTVGIRTTLTKEANRAPDHPGLDRICRAVTGQDFPVNVLCWGNLDAGTPLIDRHPETRFVVDHLGLVQPSVLPAPPQSWADLPKVLAFAQRKNAVIKVRGACTLSRAPYPFPDIGTRSPACSMPRGSSAARGAPIGPAPSRSSTTSRSSPS